MAKATTVMSIMTATKTVTATRTTGGFAFIIMTAMITGGMKFAGIAIRVLRDGVMARRQDGATAMCLRDKPRKPAAIQVYRETIIATSATATMIVTVISGLSAMIVTGTVSRAPYRSAPPRLRAHHLLHPSPQTQAPGCPHNGPVKMIIGFQ